VPSPFIGLEVEEEHRPAARAFEFDLDSRLSSVLALEARIRDDAYTAETLGTERIGNAIVLNSEGLVLTIGYLVTEADEVVLTLGDGRRVDAHVLGVDQTTGLGLLQALEPLGLPPLPIGDSRRLDADERVISAGGGGRAHASAGRIVARAPFAGYWEYHIEEALFVEPAHPHWSGAALISASGDLVGVGSLRLEHVAATGDVRPLNMFVPAELLPPILDDLARGRAATPARPWLGLFAQEVDGHVVVLGASRDSPAARAELKRGDLIREIAGKKVSDLASFYQELWSLGPPGVNVPLTLQRGGDLFDVDVRSTDRAAKLKKRRLN
jgi:S1-C subfamily serine protease